MLDVKPKDKVAFKVEKKSVRIVPALSTVDAVFQKVPALKKPLTLRQITQIAREEHVKEVANEGE